MTVSGSKSSCGVKLILSSRSMVDRRHINILIYIYRRHITDRWREGSAKAEAEGCWEGGAEVVVCWGRNSSSNIRWMKECGSRRVGNFNFYQKCRNVRRHQNFNFYSYHICHISIIKLPNCHLSIFCLSSIYQLTRAISLIDFFNNYYHNQHILLDHSN